MPCKTPCHDYLHRGGRCMCGTNASRAALGMKPLQDEPITSADDALDMALYAAVIVVALISLIVIAGAFGLVMAIPFGG
jgi:hypothetical protein